MTIKQSHDFLSFTSFPSSVKAESDEGDSRSGFPGLLAYKYVPIKSPATIRIEANIKTENARPESPAWLSCYGMDAQGKRLETTWFRTNPTTSTQWAKFAAQKAMPSGIVQLELQFAIAGSGTPGIIATTWFDDVKVYQDDVLIYSDDFSKWDPVIGAGVGAPIGGVAGYLLKEPLGPMVSEVVGAVLGGALGGGLGLLTGLGIIPVPQIPSLGAAPEGPGAPARLGKYLITG